MRYFLMKKANIISTKPARHCYICLKYNIKVTVYLFAVHSVLEWIWIKGSYPSQWLPNGEREPPKSKNHDELKPRWVPIYLMIFENQNFSKYFGSLRNFFFLYNSYKLTKVVPWKGMHHDFDSFGGHISPCGSHYLR